MEESAVYLKYSGQGFAHDAIALWTLAKPYCCFTRSEEQQRLRYHLHCIWTLPEGDANFSTRKATYQELI